MNEDGEQLELPPADSAEGTPPTPRRKPLRKVILALIVAVGALGALVVALPYSRHRRRRLRVHRAGRRRIPARICSGHRAAARDRTGGHSNAQQPITLGRLGVMTPSADPARRC